MLTAAAGAGACGWIEDRLAPFAPSATSKDHRAHNDCGHQQKESAYYQNLENTIQHVALLSTRSGRAITRIGKRVRLTESPPLVGAVR